MSKAQPVSIKSLRPTQLTVGLIEVATKKKRLEAMKPKEQSEFLEEHPMPVVIGPAKKLFITDHHHLARAALDAGIDGGFFTVEADLSSHDLASFWEKMNENQWVHPLDHFGVRHIYASLPAHLEDLVDDVYRSIAGFVRDAGGYQKTDTAFAEFIWADFFRRNIPVEEVTANFDAAVNDGLRLARSHLAHSIPGFIPK